jgi:hypothetical protein
MLLCSAGERALQQNVKRRVGGLLSDGLPTRSRESLERRLCLSRARKSQGVGLGPRAGVAVAAWGDQ